MKDVLRDAEGMRKQMEKMQEELAAKTVEGDAGAGAVRVVMNGKLEVLRVHLDRPLLTALAGDGESTDQAMIEELIAAAVNTTSEKARQLVAEEMQRLTGGLNLPGLGPLLGGT
jgi:hypothetical protein